MDSLFTPETPAQKEVADSRLDVNKELKEQALKNIQNIQNQMTEKNQNMSELTIELTQVVKTVKYYQNKLNSKQLSNSEDKRQEYDAILAAIDLENLEDDKFLSDAHKKDDLIMAKSHSLPLKKH